MKEIQYLWVLSIVLWIYNTAIDGGEAKQQRRSCPKSFVLLPIV